jgi:hypothetical protein
MARRASGCSPEIHPEASGITTATHPDVPAEAPPDRIRRTSGRTQIVPEVLNRSWSSDFAIKAEREQKHVAVNPDD